MYSYSSKITRARRYSGRYKRGRPNSSAPMLHRQQRSDDASSTRSRGERQRGGQREVDPAPRGGHLRQS